MIEDIWPLMGWGLVGMVVLMTLLWAVHLKIKNAGVVDFGWAGGLALLGGFYAIWGDGYGPRRWLIGSMVVIWGGRLAVHVLTDRVLGKREDPRYTAIREGWSEPVGLKMFLFFEFQAFLAVALSYPFALLATDPLYGLSGYEYAGAALWTLAVIGEIRSDQQLKHFKSDPANKGKTCREGLWSLSRHPNYFFEWLVWVAYFIASWVSPYGWISVLSPLAMLYFLFKVTGIPATEAHAVQSREDYRDYQQTTSAFIPWFKKS